MPEGRIVKLNEAGLKKQKELQVPSVEASVLSYIWLIFLIFKEKAGPMSKSAKKGMKSGPMALKNQDGTSSRCSTPISLDGAKQKSSRASTGSDSAG